IARRQQFRQHIVRRPERHAIVTALDRMADAIFLAARKEQHVIWICDNPLARYMSHELPAPHEDDGAAIGGLRCAALRTLRPATYIAHRADGASVRGPELEWLGHGGMIVTEACECPQPCQTNASHATRKSSIFL